ncbi:MAG: hypothetical protein HYV55_01090, partial [Parcubacteria group bacterium]|nr:hypothetical protein [Parcubacteria group bacterium]
LVLWIITKQPVVGVIFAILADGLAALPTIVKAWRHPETETGAAYATALFGAATTLFAVQTWAFSEYAFSLYLVFITSVFLFIIYRKRFMPKANFV